MASKDRKIGFVGVGLMGHGLVKNLLGGGYAVTFLDHPGNRPTDDLMAKGATPVPTLKDVADSGDVIFLCVTGSPEVRAVVMGEDNDGGLAAHLGADHIVCDCSTAIPDETLDMAKRVQETGARFLDVPMTRTPKEAEEGRLNIMVGGDGDILEIVRPMLACYGENIYHAGPVSAGHRMKLLHNYISLGFSALMAEAVVAARKGGIDMATFLDVMETGGGKGVVFDRLKPYIESGDVGAFNFSISNSAKDLGYYTDMAAALDAPHGCADAVRALYDGAVKQGKGAEPVPRVMDILDT